MTCKACKKDVLTIVEVCGGDGRHVDLCGSCTGLFVEGLADHPTAHRPRLRLVPTS